LSIRLFDSHWLCAALKACDVIQRSSGGHGGAKGRHDTATTATAESPPEIIVDEELLPYLLAAFPPGVDCQTLAGHARDQVIIRGYRFDPEALDAWRLALLQRSGQAPDWATAA
jgi:hypothetical protein